MAEAEQWSISANTALKIRLVHPSGDKKKHKVFPPDFTYPIFGEEETIFGYEGLRITLDFQADNLRPNLHVQSKAKVEEVGETKADEPEEILKEFLPKLDDIEDDVQDQPFRPPGVLQHKYELNGRQYGVWKAYMSSAETKRVIRNCQILVLLFIEGATMIDLDVEDWVVNRWTVFFLYEIERSPTDSKDITYSFVGYSTSYRLFFLDSNLDQPKLTDLPPHDRNLLEHHPSRERISQFLILPPHQGAGHGSHLYTAMVNSCLKVSSIRTITVEDPNEKFDDLRDFIDLLRLRSTSTSFRQIKLETSVKLPKKDQPLPTKQLLPAEIIDQLLTETKIASRQLSRLIEMQILSNIPERHRQLARITRKDRASDENDRAYYFWRLVVKQRLYKHNQDQLAQLEIEERVEKLEETVESVQRDYERILEVVDARDVTFTKGEQVKGWRMGMVSGPNVVDMEDEDDSEDEEEDENEDSEVKDDPGAVVERMGRPKRKRLDDEDDEDEVEEVRTNDTPIASREKSGIEKKRRVIDVDSD